MNKQERIEQITNLAVMLSAKQQSELIKMLRKQILLAKAKELSKSVKANKTTMSDIVSEVKKVRAEQFETR